MGSIPKTATSSDGENCSMRAPKLVASWMRSAIIAARSNVVPATAATIETPRTATSRSSHRITFAAGAAGEGVTTPGVTGWTPSPSDAAARGGSSCRVRALVEPLRRDTVLEGGPGEKVLGQLDDIAFARAQWRQRDHHRREPVVELAAESAGAHRGRQIEAGGRDDPHVDRFAACAPESAHLARLDGRQQLHLQGVGKLADLVEEERALMRGLDQPSLGNPRVGEGSTLEPEQLRLEQCLGNRGAVDVD